MKNVAIRLDEAKYKKLRVTVVRRGISLQAAIESLIDQYIKGSDSGETEPSAPVNFRGFLRDTNVMEERAREHRRELKRDRGRT